MPTKLSVDAAECSLRHLLSKLKLGETLTLVDADGSPEALLVSLKPPEAGRTEVDDWETQWDRLVQEISDVWQSDQSALETLSNMRR